MAYIDRDLALFGGRVFARQGSSLDANDQPAGTMFRDAQGLVEIPTRILFAEEVFVLQARFTEVFDDADGNVAPSAAPAASARPPVIGMAGPPPATRPRPSRRPQAKTSPAPSSSTPGTANVSPKAGKRAAAQKVKKAQKAKKDPLPVSPPRARPMEDTTYAIGDRRRVTALATPRALPIGASSSSHGIQTKLPFAATTPVLRAHLGRGRYAKLVGSTRIPAYKR
jgi:hypothetical protein